MLTDEDLSDHRLATLLHQAATSHMRGVHARADLATQVRARLQARRRRMIAIPAAAGTVAACAFATAVLPGSGHHTSSAPAGQPTGPSPAVPTTTAPAQPTPTQTPTQAPAQTDRPTNQPTQHYAVLRRGTNVPCTNDEHDQKTLTPITRYPNAMSRQCLTVLDGVTTNPPVDVSEVAPGVYLQKPGGPTRTIYYAIPLTDHDGPWQTITAAGATDPQLLLRLARSIRVVPD